MEHRSETPPELAAVERAAKANDRARSKLEQAIREAHTAGLALREIGRAAGMSHVHIGRLVDRSDDA